MSELDEAWAEAEAAVNDPDGRFGRDLILRALTWDGSGSYIASSTRREFESGIVLDGYESRICASPEAALRDLAAKLRSRP